MADPTLQWSTYATAVPATVTASWSFNTVFNGPGQPADFQSWQIFEDSEWDTAVAQVSTNSIPVDFGHRTRANDQDTYLLFHLSAGVYSSIEFIRWISEAYDSFPTNPVTTNGPTIDNQVALSDPITEPEYYPGDIISVERQ